MFYYSVCSVCMSQIEYGPKLPSIHTDLSDKFLIRNIQLIKMETSSCQGDGGLSEDTVNCKTVRITLLYCTVCALSFSSVQCDALQCTAVQYSAVQCSVV